MDQSKSQLRAFQDHLANQGWRIQLVPFDDPSQTMMIKTNWFAMFGTSVFIVGLVMCGVTENRSYLYAALGGFAFALLGILFTARDKRRGWKKMEAKCVDREIREVYLPASHNDSGGPVWAFRLLCKFDYAGANYTVTPAGFWRTFATEHGISNFLSKEISGLDRCFLYVNPQNPLETELAAGDIAEKLLH